MQNNFQFPVSNWSLYYVVHIVDCTCSCNNNNIGNQRKNIFVNNAIIDDDIIGRTSTTTSTRYLVDMNYELRSTVIRLKFEKKSWVPKKTRNETKYSIDPLDWSHLTQQWNCWAAGYGFQNPLWRRRRIISCKVNHRFTLISQRKTLQPLPIFFTDEGTSLF